MPRWGFAPLPTLLVLAWATLDQVLKLCTLASVPPDPERVEMNVRQRSDPTFVAQGVIHHSDAGSRYTSLAFSLKLLDHGVSGSIGRVGTAYDNALMESTIGLFKSELLHARQVGWGSRQEVEKATARWVRWFNDDRLHSALDYLSPTEFEVAYTHRQGQLGLAA